MIGHWPGDESDEEIATALRLQRFFVFEVGRTVL